MLHWYSTMSSLNPVCCCQVSQNFTNGFVHNFVERLAIRQRRASNFWCGTKGVESSVYLSMWQLQSQFSSFKSLEIYRPGSQRGGFAARRRQLPEWCVEEQKWCRRRCRWVVQGSLPGQCSYRLHRGGTPLQELALLPVVMPKTPGEGRTKGVRKLMEGDNRIQNVGILKYMMEDSKKKENISSLGEWRTKS